jgi:hypothetical protein
MQVNATIIAAQQAAREARATLFQPGPAAPKPAASFLAALDKEGAAPAPARQAAAATPAAAPQAPTRPGSLLDIKI